ncbi:MAG: ABC transporter ATP-binding protein [Pelagibacteraceae bacterium TMED233]|nr:MAG: ABC transporter ATP-binding protein [Pelagibacteraceae bacterium TMED233]
MNNIIEIKNLYKSFFLKKKINILKNISVKIKKGDLVSLLGPSGSGKSTFLHLLAMLDRPTKGDILFNKKKYSEIINDDNHKVRGEKISIIYQQNNLLSDFTAIENVFIQLLSLGEDKDSSIKKSKKILTDLGLKSRLNHFPSDLSGGEQQRVAIARAFITSPELILADEPTGSLDTANSNDIFNLFLKLKSKKTTIIYATHNMQLANRADYKLSIIDGNIRRSNGKKSV